MSAREMFEELGYKYDSCEDEIEYSKIDGEVWTTYYIYFYLDEKTFACFTDNNNRVNDINLEELKAIQKQIEELGWE